MSAQPTTDFPYDTLTSSPRSRWTPDDIVIEYEDGDVEE